MKSVFLSHNSKDKPFVRKLATILSENGIKVWLDEAEINVGDSLVLKISEAIEDTDFICAVISDNSINSPWVQKELSLSMAKEVTNNEVTVLPIILDNCGLPHYLKDKLYVDFSVGQDFSLGVNKLLRAINKQEVIFHKNKNLSAIEDRNSLRFGVSLGWQLGRFEFIYGSEFEEAKLATQSVEDDIQLLLKLDGYGVLSKYETFQELCGNILTYYSVKSPDKHAAILLGIAGLRISLSEASKNVAHNLGMKELALSAIMEIDSRIVREKRKLFEFLAETRANNVPSFIEAIDRAHIGEGRTGHPQ